MKFKILMKDKKSGIVTNEAEKDLDSLAKCQQFINENPLSFSNYNLEIIDITQDVESERIKKETKKSERVSRVDQLKAIDWATVDTVKELKDIVKLLVKEAIKDDE